MEQDIIKEFEVSFNLNKFDIYNIQGQAISLIYNKQKYLNSNNENIHINNYYTNLIIISILSVLCIGVYFTIKFSILFGIITLIISYIFLASIIYTSIKKNSIAKSLENNIKRKVLILKSGLKIEADTEIKIKWEQIELIAFTNKALMITLKNSNIIVIIESRQEIFNEIKKHTKAKIINLKTKDIN